MPKPAGNPESEPADDEQLVRSGYRYALALTHNTHDAEDLVQEAWLKWADARDKGRVPGESDHAQAYFLKIIRNTFIDSHREGRRMIIEPLSNDDGERLIDLEGDSPEYDATPDEVRKALGKLGPGEREALFLSAYEDLTAREIAERTNTSRGTILSRLQRGREKLARLLGGEDARGQG